MPSLVNSAEFRALRQQLKYLYANKIAGDDYDVFVISRFDGDDETIRPYLSNIYSDHHDPSLYPAKSLQKAKGNSFRDADRQGGGHAEEKFVRSLNELGEMFGVPQVIEVYVSRIPCASTSRAWSAHKPFEPEDMFWPAGCGPKFLIAMKATPHIAWHLYWEEGYEKNLKAHSESLGQLTLLSQLPNVTVAQWTP